MVKLSYYLKVSIVIQSSGASPFCHVSYHIFVAKLRKSIRHLRNEKKKLSQRFLELLLETGENIGQ